MKLIIISGGSGVGKTSALQKVEDRQLIKIVHQDDYILHPRAPITPHGANNDHPIVVDWEKLHVDIETALGTGDVIAEGTLLLRSKILRERADIKIYLDLHEDERLARRKSKTALKDYPYIEKILRPMHEKYVESSKEYADEILDINKLSLDDVAQKIVKMINVTNRSFT